MNLEIRIEQGEGAYWVTATGPGMWTHRPNLEEARALAAEWAEQYGGEIVEDLDD